jgi:uncharacterized caspase-like protein
MRNSRSLTDAIKRAAAGGASLTDAVKDAAREVRDCAIISFPRDGLDGRHDGSQGGRHPWGLTPAVDSPARPSGIACEPAAQERRPAFFRRAGSEPKSIASGPIALTRRNPLANPIFRFLTVGGKLAGIVVLSLLSLVAAPSAVGPDRPAMATPQKRVALVIGNSAYRHARKLDNPRNDAADVGAALRKLGFQVIEGFDLDKAALEARIRVFTGILRGADVGVFFYAGHGLHVAGHNYIVPVDAALTVASALDQDLIRLDNIHRTMEREAATNVLFFDACRDNPIADNLAEAMGGRSAEIGRKLAVVASGVGTLVSFSTQPGKLALDGKGRNSPYSGALVRQLTTSNEDLAAMLIAVRNDVMRETDRKQVPWEHSALTGRFYFNPASAKPAPAPTTHLRAREAFEAWSATRDTASIAVLEAFIARYRDTFYADLARVRIEELKGGDGATHLSSSVGDAAPPR